METKRRVDNEKTDETKHRIVRDLSSGSEIERADLDNSRRTTGGEPGSFAIVGPNWKGTLPEGVKALPSSRTNRILIYGRTLVDGETDLPRYTRHTRDAHR